MSPHLFPSRGAISHQALVLMKGSDCSGSGCDFCLPRPCIYLNMDQTHCIICILYNEHDFPTLFVRICASLQTLSAVGTLPKKQTKKNTQVFSSKIHVVVYEEASTMRGGEITVDRKRQMVTVRTDRYIDNSLLLMIHSQTT